MRLAPPALVCVTSLLVLGASSCFGCDDPQPLLTESSDATADTGTRDSVVRDTGPWDTGWRDTGGELLGRTCERIVTGFKCPTLEPKVGQSVCTDAMLEQFLSCFSPDWSSIKCSAAQKAFPECNKCVLGEWLAEDRFDVAACVVAVAPKSVCAVAVGCALACRDAACPPTVCDQTPGSGIRGGSEYEDCLLTVESAGSSTKPKGACYEVAAKDYAICAASPDLAVCFPKVKRDLLPFYRGACRDGGDWSHAIEATDAGSDALDAPTADVMDGATDSVTDAPTDT
ncbi:MAG: hypothetical protein IPJ34_17140 [Myxococcales bacterium]|nr:hypothetical protein [Myxococcales bacterium]